MEKRGEREKGRRGGKTERERGRGAKGRREGKTER